MEYLGKAKYIVNKSFYIISNLEKVVILFK